MRVISLFVIIGCFISTLYSMQEQKEIYNSSSDSLKEKTLQELNTLFWNSKNQDSIIKHELANFYIVKAKKNKDREKIADGYQMFLSIYEKQPEISLRYIDSIINVTKDLENNHYPSTGYMMKGNLLSGVERYDESLEAYLIAKKYAEINDNGWQLMGLKHNIALLKTILGKEEEALLVFKENYNHFKKQDEVEKPSQIYIATLYGLSKSYNRLKKYDSAYFYLQKGIKSSLSSNRKFYYSDLLFAFGINSYYRNEYNPAIDSLQKALNLFEDDINKSQVRISYLYLGKIYLKIKEEPRALSYLQKVDAVTNDSNYRLEIRDAFTLLIDHYKKSNDQNNQLKVMEKLVRYDSISAIKQSRLNNSIVKKYDTPQLIKDKDQLIREIVNNNKRSTYRLIVLSAFVMVGISFLFRYFYKKRKSAYKTLLNKELKRVEVLEKKNSKSVKTSLDLSVELKQEILKKLSDFESDLGYLKNDLTLAKVSKSLKTNSTYLSNVINMEKQKNFATYINDLRIAYCILKIEENKMFRQYSIKSMAKEVGFNNIQSFAKAFSKNKGCNPAEYVKRYRD